MRIVGYLLALGYILVFFSHQAGAVCEKGRQQHCWLFRDAEIRFRGALKLQRHSCQVSKRKQTLRLHWEHSGPPQEVYCFLFPLSSIQQQVFAEDPGSSAAFFEGALNASARATDNKRHYYKCDLWIPTGTWIPLIAYRSNSPSEIEQWVMSDIHLDTKIVQSEITDVYPRLGMTGSKTAITVTGRFLRSPASCHIIPHDRRTRRGKTFAAVFVNSTTIKCHIQGEEGPAKLLVSWNRGCSEEIDIEFLTRPMVTGIAPVVLPMYGSAKFEIRMRSGRPDADNALTLFLPTRVRPSIRLSCLENATINGTFEIRSDDVWVTGFEIEGKRDALVGRECRLHYSLNDQDFFRIDQVVRFSGPLVRFLAIEEAVAHGESTKIAVLLNRPASLPVSISLKLHFPRRFKHVPDLFVVDGTLTWNPGEIGIKYFVIKDKEKHHHLKRSEFEGRLIDAVNCDVDDRKGRIKLVMMKRPSIPVFALSDRQVLYPPSDDVILFNVTLKSGRVREKSVLSYKIIARHLNTDIKGSNASQAVPKMHGRLRWNNSEKKMSISVPVHWDSIDYTDEIEVTVVLNGLKLATVASRESVGAVIYGTPKGFCPPGTVNRRRKTKPLPFLDEASQELSLSTIVVEGQHYHNGDIHETALVPPFTAEQLNYTAMIPHDMKDIRLKLINKGTPKDVRIDDRSCSVNENLSWVEASETSGTFLQSELRLKEQFYDCTLKIESFAVREVSQEYGEIRLRRPEETATGPVEEMEDILEEIPTVFNIDFLQLSDPDVALLSSAEVRNATHVLTLCGPKTSIDDAQDIGPYERIPGHPKGPCRLRRINYVGSQLDGSDLMVIPRLKHPDSHSTRIEVSGMFLNQSTTQLTVGEETVMATMFRGLHLTNASLSFDIRVTAADNVTSNLYRFVYGKRHSRYQYYAARSSFDVAHTIPQTNTASTENLRSGTCHRCPLGMFSIGVDALQCSLCRPGHYANNHGSAKCLPCPKGTFTYTWGSDMCRPCLFGSVATREGSEFCRLCPEGYITKSDGNAHCTVLVESTDLHRYYAVIVSFGVVLNGTTLEQIDRLGRTVHASGIVVLKMLVRTDVAHALNISVGDVAVHKVAPLGRRALSLEVDTTFKVEVSEDAEPDEVKREVEATMLKGDTNVHKLANDPDSALHRTTTATHTRARVNSTSTTFRTSNPDDWKDDRWVRHQMLIYMILGGCLVSILGLIFFCIRHRRRSKNAPRLKSFSWFALQERDETRNNYDAHMISPFGFIRHRTFSTRPAMDP